MYGVNFSLQSEAVRLVFKHVDGAADPATFSTKFQLHEVKRSRAHSSYHVSGKSRSGGKTRGGMYSTRESQLGISPTAV